MVERKVGHEFGKFASTRNHDPGGRTNIWTKQDRTSR